MVDVGIKARNVIDGKLISVTVELRDPNEVKIYKKFLEDEEAFKKCPHCGQSNTVGKDDLRLRIDSPLSNNHLLSAATPLIRCDHCGEEITLSMLDYSCFPSVTAFLAKLRNAYNLKKKEKKSNG